MSKFEAELRLPCKQQFAYINLVLRAEDEDELLQMTKSIRCMDLIENLSALHGVSYDIVMGTIKPKPATDPRDLIVSELGGKVISEDEKAAPEAQPEKPWERKKPAATKAADPNDPFANFK